MKWLWALLLASCTPATRRVIDPFDASLAAADLVWESRAAAGSVDEAERKYVALLVERSQSGAVLWRMARVAWSRALISPSTAAIWHEAGREYAMRCLTAEGVMSESVYRIGDRMDPAVIQALPTSMAPCLVYAAAHTVALARVRGPGALLDMDDVGPLLGGNLGELGDEAALSAWARGHAAEASGDTVAGRRELHLAVSLAPGQRFFRESATVLFPDLEGEWPTFDADPRWALENGKNTTTP